ncbi:MAG: type II secretion system protein [Thiobacillus sp.]
MKKQNKGFTLIEVLLVVAIIAILAGIVIIAVNPSKQLGDSRNAQRRADVNTIINAVYQYTLDHNGSLPTTSPAISTISTAVCTTAGSCGSYVDLSDLTTNGKYLVSIPKDPSNPAAPSSGYFISKDSNNRVTVNAPSAENSATISVTR